jgi:asparagine synthase (glutamine-hydrolysing)
MCGIAGWLGSIEGSDQVAARVIAALHHRGPDAHGIWSRPQVTLLHARLSIIDLSPAGGQPMTNEDGTVWTIFNGEIYNHGELRRGLELRGHKFKGRSDGEVLPHLYEEEGITFVGKLRGMFAFAVYDARKRILFLGRDRFGIKPLFYETGYHRLAFASEIKALLELPGIDSRPDRQAIYDFSALFYIPAPETFYAGIRTLQPGEVLEARLDSERVLWNTRNYHKWTIAPDFKITLDQAIERADALIEEAVHRQMESDVPLGALLSGGIDSSVVSTVAQNAHDNGIRTFNVRFSEEEYDETWAAEAVAKHIGSHHTTLDMDGRQGTWDQITELLVQAGQPFADTSLFAVNAVCRLMRKHVKVALSGDGGDEAFGGYNFHWQLALIARLQRLPMPVWHAASVALIPLVRFGFVHPHRQQRFTELTGADDVAVIQRLLTWVREEEQHRLCLDDGKVLPIRRLFEPQWEHRLPRGVSRIERLSALATEASIRLVLPNDFLFKVDTASMKESLEIRVPMLDEDLFAFGLSLPHSLKVRGRTCKKVLRGVAERRLPLAVARKPKKGFVLPVNTWVDTDFKTRLRNSLLGPSSRLPEFFNPQIYKPIVEAFCEDRLIPGISKEGLYSRVIMFLSIQLTTEHLA